MQKSCVVKEIVVLDKTIYYYDDLIDMSAFTLPDCHWITINWLVLQQCVCIKNHCLSLEGKNNKIQPLLRKNFMQICTKFVFIRMTNIQFTFVPSSCLKIRLLYEFFNTTSSSIALPKKSKLGKNTHTHHFSLTHTQLIPFKCLTMNLLFSIFSSIYLSQLVLCSFAFTVCCTQYENKIKIYRKIKRMNIEGKKMAVPILGGRETKGVV